MPERTPSRRASPPTGFRPPARGFCWPPCHRFLIASCTPARSEFLLTLRRMRWSLLTIALMMSIGFITRYSGTDATLGLAFRTGVLYPFFSALLGWLGVALTGSDTSSNVLFGSLQKITAQQLGLSRADRRRQQLRRRHGQDDRRAIIVVASTATNSSGTRARSCVSSSCIRSPRGRHSRGFSYRRRTCEIRLPSLYKFLWFL